MRGLGLLAVRNTRIRTLVESMSGLPREADCCQLHACLYRGAGSPSGAKGGRTAAARPASLSQPPSTVVTWTSTDPPQGAKAVRTDNFVPEMTSAENDHGTSCP